MTTKNTANANEIRIVIVLVLTVENLGRLWGEKRHWKIPVENTGQLWGHKKTWGIASIFSNTWQQFLYQFCGN